MQPELIGWIAAVAMAILLFRYNHGNFDLVGCMNILSGMFSSSLTRMIRIVLIVAYISPGQYILFPGSYYCEFHFLFP